MENPDRLADELRRQDAQTRYDQLYIEAVVEGMIRQSIRIAEGIRKEG